MFSRCPDSFRCVIAAVAAIAACAGFATTAPTVSSEVLRVVADPNNLPFSNEAGEGFENRIVALLAADLGARVEYTWWAQRRGWVRTTLKEGSCDIVPAVPAGFERLLTTQPYYRSTYTMVYRTARKLGLTSLDDPQLRELRVGVQMIGDDFSNTPPAHALSRRGIITNVRGYTVYGDYSRPNPPARILEALLREEIDVAFVWGPLAGHFARRHGGELTLVALPPRDPLTGLPLAFSIAVGVRRNEPALRDALNAILARRRADIAAILAEFGVPQLPVGGDDIPEGPRS